MGDNESKSDQAVETTGLDGEREGLMKAFFVSQEGVAESNALPDQVATTSFSRAGALISPNDPWSLAQIFEHSNSLRQNVDAYAVNVDGFGHRFEPAIDTDSNDARKRVADAIVLERLRQLEIDNEGKEPEAREDPDPEALQPTEEEVEAELKELIRSARLEKFKLEAFFEAVSLETSFVRLRKRTRLDIEVTGNGYWEGLRNGEAKLAEFVYLPSYTMRLMPIDPAIDVETKVRRTALTIESVKRRRRFRRFVQVIEGVTVFFKELGDPRLMSAKTGRFYDNVAAMQTAENNTGIVATEVLHFKVDSPRSPYGVPRWIGNLISVLGSRSSEEVNYLYFQNKSIPPLAMIVSGGRATKSTIERIEKYLEHNLKGIKNFHRILILEADPSTQPGMGPDTTGRMRIELKPLTSAQQKDALFQDYDESNRDKVGESFRVPRILRANTKDFNRATAEAALSFTESQVFQPERTDFDWIMDAKVLVAELEIRYWRFASNDPVTRNPIEMAKILKDLVGAGILFLEEARTIAADIFNSDLARTGEWWARVPINLAERGIIGQSDAPSLGGESDDKELDGKPGGKPEAGKPEAGEPEAEPEKRDPVTDVGQQAQAAAKQIRTKLLDRIAKGDATVANVVEAHQLFTAVRKAAEPALAVEAERLAKVRDAMLEAEKDEASERLDQVRDETEVEIEVVHLDELSADQGGLR